MASMTSETPPQTPLSAAHRYNREYRHRFGLRRLRRGDLRAALVTNCPPPLPDGMPDPLCAVLAQYIAARTTRYALASIVNGQVVGLWHADLWHEDRSFLAIVENPSGTQDNLAKVRSWLRKMGNDARESTIAGMAAGHRDDDMTPTDEYLSGDGLREVAYIFGRDVDTVRGWADAHRRGMRSKLRGRPPSHK